MIAVDTNLLVYAHREDSQWHASAFGRLAELAEGRSAWAIPWPCLHEFLANVTHPRIYAPPTPLTAASSARGTDRAEPARRVTAPTPAASGAESAAPGERRTANIAARRRAPDLPAVQAPRVSRK